MSQFSAVPGMKVHTNRDGTQVLIPATVDVGIDDVSVPGGFVNTRYISPTAMIGENVKILSSARIMAGAMIGEGSEIGHDVRVAPCAIVPSYWIIPDGCVVNRSADAPPHVYHTIH